MRSIKKANGLRGYWMLFFYVGLFYTLVAGICNAQVKSDNFQLSLELGTIGHLDFESQLKASAQAGWRTIGIRTNRVEEYLATGKTFEDANGLLEKYSLRAIQIGFFFNWIYVKKESRPEMLDRFRKFSRIAAKMGHALILATTQCEGSHDDVLARENLTEICRIAAEDGNRIAVEFLPYSPVDTVKKLWDIIKAANIPNAGIALDPFHYFKGGSRLEDLKEVPIEKIFVVHINDLKAVNPDVDLITLTRNYRVLPGEGSFPLGEILGYLFDRGYSGYYCLEVLNKDYTSEDPVKLGIRGRESLEKLLKDYAQQRTEKATK